MTGRDEDKGKEGKNKDNISIIVFISVFMLALNVISEINSFQLCSKAIL